MGANISEDDVRNALARVKHPMIDRTLLELGIIKHMAVEQPKVKVTLAFPFPNVPIKDQIIHSVREPIQKLGAEIEVKLIFAIAKDNAEAENIRQESLHSTRNP